VRERAGTGHGISDIRIRSQEASEVYEVRETQEVKEKRADDAPFENQGKRGKEAQRRSARV
jgi:hypothetical protein